MLMLSFVIYIDICGTVVRFSEKTLRRSYELPTTQNEHLRKNLRIFLSYKKNRVHGIYKRSVHDFIGVVRHLSWKCIRLDLDVDWHCLVHIIVLYAMSDTTNIEIKTENPKKSNEIM